MEKHIIVTALVLFLTPILGLLLTATGLFNISKKELFDFFEKVQKYIHKRKIENLSKIIDPESAGILKIGEDTQVNTDTLKSLSKGIDDVQFLEKYLSVTRRYSCNFYYSLLFIIFLGILYSLLSYQNIKINFVENNYVLVIILIVIYVFGGLVSLFMKKEKLEKLYSNEYDI